MHVNKEAIVPGAYLNFPIGYNSENFIRNIFLSSVILIVVLDKTAIPSFLPINPMPSFDLPLIDKISLFIPVNLKFYFLFHLHNLKF